MQMVLRDFRLAFGTIRGVAGMESSVRYILRLGIENIRKKNLKIANVLRINSLKFANIKIHGPDDEHFETSIVSFLWVHLPLLTQ